MQSASFCPKQPDNPIPLKSRPLYIFCSIENTLIILLIILTAFAFNRKKGNINLALFSFYYCLSLYSLIGLTTPVIGAICRYKLPGLLFLLIGIIALFNKETIQKSRFFELKTKQH